MPFDCIYVCGDSHSAGGELADDRLWPTQHPGFFRESEIATRDIRQILTWRQFRTRQLNRGEPVGYQQWQDAEKQHAWPALLAKLIDIPVVNGAVIGASMEWVARETMTWLAARGTDWSRVLVILQPPTWVRMQRFDASSRTWTSWQLGDASDIPAVVNEWYLLSEDDHSLLTRWLLHLMGICALISSRGGTVRLLDADMPNMPSVVAAQSSLAELRQLHTSACDDLWLPVSMGHAARTVELCRCPDLHWSRPVHEKVANDIAAIVAKLTDR